MGALQDASEDAFLTIGEGQKLVDLFCNHFDGDDRELIRVWFDERMWTAARIRRELAAQGFVMGEDTVRHGLRRLKEAGWDASRT